MNKDIAININFDSLSEAFGFPNNFKDPSYFKIYDRFNDYANKYNFKYSIFLIGKDLQNSEIASRIKDWSEQGHEIGNHTWSHPMNLGSLTKKEIEYEILKCHEIIHNIINIEPRGFIAPAWSISDNVLDILFEHKYLYDTSYFTSVWLYPVMSKILLNHKDNKEQFKKIISRKDWLYPLYKNNDPHIIRKDKSHTLIELPLPTINHFSLPYWHTINFIFGEKLAHKKIKQLIEKGYFYYLLHPSDLIDKSDIENNEHSLERIDIPLNDKRKILDKCFELLKGYNIISMEDLANKYKKKLIIDNSNI